KCGARWKLYDQFQVPQELAAMLQINMAKGGDGAAKCKVAEVAMGVAQCMGPKIECSSTANTAEEVHVKMKVLLVEEICIVLVKSGDPASKCTRCPASKPLEGPVCDKTAEHHSVDH